MMDRTAMASPCMTTGRLTIASVVSMAACGGLTRGWDIIEPRAPVLFSVNVPPRTSSNVSLLSLARWVISREARASPAMVSLLASCIIGTTRPCGAATAMPTLIRFLSMIPFAPQVELSMGCSVSASESALSTNGR